MNDALKFMEKIFSNKFAERAPELKEEEEAWRLPIFAVYHPQKKKIRMVFDSSAKFENTSLNEVLLTGPDLMNSLIGVLLRFRSEQVAISADVEQMFHCFKVTEEHHKYLRFSWYDGNDPAKPLVEYQMCVHVFGNSPSPAVATFGLRKAAQAAEPEFGSEVRDYVDRDFYVDDGLKSVPTSQEAINLLQSTKQALEANGKLRLHKIASNSKEVLGAFEASELASDLTNVELASDELPEQTSLGLIWNLERDTFKFRVASCDKPFTRRGVLSYVNSLYDPLGFLSPFTIRGKLLIREMTSALKVDWDTPLPKEHHEMWIHFTNG